MNCSDLYVLSTIACQLSNCLTDEELAVLSADLTTLADMLASLLAHRAVCEVHANITALTQDGCSDQ